VPVVRQDVLDQITGYVFSCYDAKRTHFKTSRIPNCHQATTATAPMECCQDTKAALWGEHPLVGEAHPELPLAPSR
jgi:hypothetical protein